MEEAINPKNLVDLISGKAKEIGDKNAGNIGVIIIKSAIKGLDVAIKSIDKFLQVKGVNVKDLYEKGRNKASSLVDKAKSSFENVKQVGLKNIAASYIQTGKEKISNMMGLKTGPPGEGIISYSLDKFKGFIGEVGDLAQTKSGVATLAQDSLGNPVIKLVENESGKEIYLSIEKYKKLKQILTLSSDQEIQENFDTSVLVDPNKKSLLDRVKGVFSKKEDNIEDTDSQGEKKESWYQKLKGRMSRRKSEIEDEKNNVKGKGKKEGSGWLGKILSGIMTAGGFIVSKLTGALQFLGGFVVKGLWSGLQWLAPGIVKALGGLISSVIPSLAGGIASLTQAGVGGMLKTAGGLALRGAGMVLSGPVGWAIAAGTALYAGYKLYKYMTNGSFKDDVYGKLSKLRMHTYGFNDKLKNYYGKLLDLDMLMEPYVKYENNNVTVTSISKEDREKILDIFGVDKNDKDQFGVMTRWFNRRYLPSFKAFMLALNAAKPGIKLENLDKLKPEELSIFISRYNIPGNIYKVDLLPIAEHTPPATKEEVDKIHLDVKNLITSKDKTSTSDKSTTTSNEQPSSFKDKAFSAIKTGLSPILAGKDFIDKGVAKARDAVLNTELVGTIRNSEFAANVNNKFMNVKQGLKESKDKVTTYLKDQLSPIKDNITRVATEAKDLALNAVMTQFDSMKEKVQGFVGRMTDSVNKLFEPIAGVMTKAKDLFNNIKDTVSSKIDGVKNTAKDLFNKALSGVNSALEKTGIFAAVQFGVNMYDGIKKLFTSNKSAYSIQILRFYLYGFGKTHVFYHNKLSSLDYLLNSLVTFKDKAEISKIDSSTTSKILDLFSVPTKEENATKFEIFDTWFKERYLPIFLLFTTAIKSIDSKYSVFDIGSLNDTQLLDLINRLTVPASIHNVKVLPVLDNATVVPTKEEIDKLTSNTISELRGRITEKDNISAIKEKKPESKKTSTKETTVEKEKPKTETNKKPDIKSMTPPDQEGEPKLETDIKSVPKDGGTDLNKKVQGKLNIAQGDIIPGGNDLSGIATKLDTEKIYNLDPNVKELFLGMSKEYNTLTGKKLGLNEAFRSYEDQAAMYKKYPGKAAKPGFSTHEFGLALDVNSADVKALNDLGLLRKYGFTTSVGGEGWHIEPIGVSLNPSLAKADESFRQKAILSSPGRGGDGYGLLSGSTMKRRNINYQQSIFDSNKDNAIDPSTLVKDSESPMTKMDSLANNNNTPESTKPTTSSGISSTSLPGEGEGKPSEVKVASASSGGYSSSVNKTMSNNGVSSTSSLSNTPLTTTKSSVPTTNPNLDISSYGDIDPVTAIKQVSSMTGVDENTMLTFAKMESSLNPNAGASGTSAKGLYQFVDGTWKEMVKKYGDNYGIKENADVFNPVHNGLMAAHYVKDNSKIVGDTSDLGLNPTGSLYLSHFLGPGGAKKLVNGYRKDPNAPVSQVASASAIKANKNILGVGSISEVINVIKKKVGLAESTPVESYLSGKAPKTTVTTSQVSKPSISNTTTSSGSTPEPMAKQSTSKPESSSNSTGSTIISSASPSVKQPTMSSGISSTSSSSTPETTAASNPHKDVFTSSSKVESILSDQLKALLQMSSTLNSINEKFDMSKLSQTPNSQPSKKQEPLVPPNSINLSRKSISA